MRYCENIVLNAGVGEANPATYQFNLNGCYDPNQTGTGHQPMSFDQMMLLYAHYRVRGGRIQVTAFANGYNQMIGIGICGTYSTATSCDQMVEEPFTTCKPLVNGQVVPTVVTNSWRLADYFGETSASSTTAGDNSTNPSDTVVGTVYVVSPTAAEDPGNLTIEVVIEFDTEFYEPRLLPSS